MSLLPLKTYASSGVPLFGSGGGGGGGGPSPSISSINFSTSATLDITKSLYIADATTSVGVDAVFVTNSAIPGVVGVSTVTANTLIINSPSSLSAVTLSASDDGNAYLNAGLVGSVDPTAPLYLQGTSVNALGQFEVFPNITTNAIESYKVSKTGTIMNTNINYDIDSGDSALENINGYSAGLIATSFGRSIDVNGVGVITHRRVNPDATFSTMGSVAFGAGAGGSVGTFITGLSPPAGGAGTALTLRPYASTILVSPQYAVLTHSQVAAATNTYVPPAGTTQTIASFPSEVGHLYDVRIPVRYDTIGPVPAAGEWASLTTDATNAVALDTVDLVQVRTLGQQYEKHICGSVVASGTTTNILALGNPVNTVSTAITIQNPSALWIRDLGIPTAP